MGVTTIESSHRLDNSVLIGSYDESVRLWDLRTPRNCVSQLGVGGGVWRIKAQENNDYIAIAAMSGGFKIIQNTSSTLAPFLEYTGHHNSLAYGLDWVGDYTMLAGASFYDSFFVVIVFGFKAFQV